MKRILFPVFVMAVVCSMLLSFEVLASDVNEETGNDIIHSSIYSFSEKSSFDGNNLKPAFELSDYCKLNVESHGGVHESEEKKVYSNYVLLSLDFQYDSLLYLDSDVRIQYCDDKKISGNWVGQKNGKYDLQTKVGYGAVVVSKQMADGSRRIYKWLQVRERSSGMEPISITEDGDYYIQIFFEAVCNGVTQKYVAEYIVPIRSSIFVTDVSGEYHVKDSHFYYDAVKLDFAGRRDVAVTVDGKYVADGHVIRELGNHVVKVYGAGYLSEVFAFEIVPHGSNHFMLQGANLCKKIGDGIYLAEQYFSVNWYSRSDNVVATYQLDGADPVSYSRNAVLTQEGFYMFTVKSGIETQHIGVMLIADNCPSYNYDILSGNRYNNFISCWYEVKDEETNQYYCFNTGEYSKAFSAAMSFEKNKVTYYGNRYVYANRHYATSAEVSRAMSENVAKNINLVYYDIDNSTVEKNFSNRLFDGTRYLNDNFKFVSIHPAESASVYLVDELGMKFDIDYNKEISTYKLPNGVYTVVETDKYGNTNEYSVVVDKAAPELYLTLEDQLVLAQDGAVYNASRFSISELVDALDQYALVCINNVDFSLSNELNNNFYGESGNYFIKAYDRNGNVIRCMVTIPVDNCVYGMVETDSDVEFTLMEGYRISDIIVGDEFLENSDNGVLVFEKKNEEQKACVRIISSSGETFAVSVTIPPLMSDVVETNKVASRVDIVVYIIAAIILVVTLVAGIVLICVGNNRRGARVRE